ncbi:MAG: BrnT family toxin [Acetobacteraceae bacterium]
MNPLLLLPDERHIQGAPRFDALGCMDDGRGLLIAFTMREDGRLIRVISTRDMNRRERALYEQEAQAGAGMRQ